MPTRSPERTSAVPDTGPNARPLAAYAAIMGAFGALHALAVLRRRAPPLGLLDAAMLVLASYQFGRTIARDQVTSPLRAPFVETRVVENDNGEPEVRETPAGSGLRVALGQLLTCPDCVALWGAGLQTWGWLVVPRVARPLVWILAASGGANLLQRAQESGRS